MSRAHNLDGTLTHAILANNIVSNLTAHTANYNGVDTARMYALDLQGVGGTVEYSKREKEEIYRTANWMLVDTGNDGI